MLNKVFLIGNLGRDPEVRALPSGDPVASLSLATNRRWKDRDGNRQEDTEWHQLVCYGRQAEVAGQYLKRGRQRSVAGIDRVSIDDFRGELDRHLTDLRDEIRTQCYRPLPVLRIRPAFLPASDRALVVPAVRDRVVHRAIADLLSPEIEPTLSEACRAFRKGSSAMAAADDVGRWIERGTPGCCAPTCEARRVKDRFPPAAVGCCTLAHASSEEPSAQPIEWKNLRKLGLNPSTGGWSSGSIARQARTCASAAAR